MKVNTYKTSFPFSGDTLELFKELNEGSGDKVLYESRDSCGEKSMQSLIFASAALRVEYKGEKVTFLALNDNGLSALDEIAPYLGAIAEIGRKGDRIDAKFEPRSNTGSDIERIKAPSALDAVRLLSQGWKHRSGGRAQLKTPGVFSYDLIGRYEELPKAKADRLEFPYFVFWLPDRTVTLNHLKKEASVVAHEYGQGPLSAGRADGLIEDLVDRLRTASARQAPTLRPSFLEQLNGPNIPEVEVDLDDEEFAGLVNTLKEHISAGDVFQIVPSRTFSTHCPDPLAAFGSLRELNPSPYMFFLSWDRYTLLGSSPEACIRVSGSPRKVEIHPIAGTRPRGMTPEGRIDTELDSRMQAELMLNEKELAEHMMLVDLARNDVARVSKPGTRRVVRLAEVERYSHVMHLVSMVDGELRDDLDPLHAYVASMNMGTLVGAPKIEAARLLRRYEADQRGPYGGAVGYVTSEGELDTAIVIRSALVENGVAHIRAGAGVVRDSDPQAEAMETRIKAGAVLKAVQAAKEIPS
jgi:anthranilate synthase component 1